MSESALIPADWNVPEEFRRRLGKRVGRQRAMAADGHLLLVLHAPPRQDQVDRQGRLFWRTPEGTWRSDALGDGPEALKRHLDEYEAALAALDRKETSAAAALEYLDVLEQLAPLHRAARNLYQVLQDARKSFPEYRELIDVRDGAYVLDRTAELLFSETKNSLDVLVARRAEEQLRSSEQMAVAAHRLNLLVAFFFPVATLTAMFGVNLKHGLEDASPPYYFLGLIGVGLLLGVLLTTALMRRA